MQTAMTEQTESPAKIAKPAKTHRGTRSKPHPAALLAPPVAQHYLESLQELAQELDSAMAALASRTLPAFETSVSRQLVLCARLGDLTHRSKTGPPANSDAATAPIDTELSGRIAAATATLITLNKRYSALLRHSGDTLRLFAGLFRAYPGPTSQRPAPPASLRTWSCQL